MQSRSGETMGATRPTFFMVVTGWVQRFAHVVVYTNRKEHGRPKERNLLLKQCHYRTDTVIRNTKGQNQNWKLNYWHRRKTRHNHNGFWWEQNNKNASRWIRWKWLTWEELVSLMRLFLQKGKKKSLKWRWNYNCRSTSPCWHTDPRTHSVLLVSMYENKVMY